MRCNHKWKLLCRISGTTVARVYLCRKCKKRKEVPEEKS